MHQPFCLIYLLLAFAAAAMLPGAAHAGWFGPWEDIWEGKDDTAYHVVIDTQGEAPKTLKTTLAEVQKNLEARPSATAGDESYLRYRFSQDENYLKKALEAEGYYKAVIDGQFDASTHTSSFSVTPGPRYTFGQVTLMVSNHNETRNTPLAVPDHASLKATGGKPARAAVVMEDIAAITEWMEAHNCLFDYSVTHEAHLNYTTQRIDITYHIDAGREATVGAIRFEGKSNVAADYLQKKIPIQTGDCFKRSKINDAQVALQRTGLLAHTTPVLPQAPASDGSVPVTFKISDRAQRTIKAGTSYSTDVGPGVTAGWEHRNALGHGEKLSSNLSASPIKRTLDAKFEKPYFLRDDQKLSLGSKLEQSDTDAYTSTGLTLSAGIERDLGNQWLAGVGTQYGFTRINDLVSKQNVALLSFPVFISQDKRDDALNPTTGWTLRADTEPFFDTIDSNTSFFKNQLQGSYYHPLPVSKGSVVAMRAATGNILGVSTNTVPATERFYTGGSSSIRGYAYQEAGPLDANNDPKGGRSYVESSLELRFRFLEDYGFVTFVDAGNTFDDAYPDLSQKLLWGTGFGLRYYTDFGPIRADIAFPMVKRPTDSAYQLYFSIGQAF